MVRWLAFRRVCCACNSHPRQKHHIIIITRQKVDGLRNENFIPHGGATENFRNHCRRTQDIFVQDCNCNWLLCVLVFIANFSVKVIIAILRLSLVPVNLQTLFGASM